jgi:hypothetical protein
MELVYGLMVSIYTWSGKNYSRYYMKSRGKYIGLVMLAKSMGVRLDTSHLVRLVGKAIENGHMHAALPESEIQENDVPVSNLTAFTITL